MDTYDGFALIYNRHWGPRYAAAAPETLGPLVMSRIPPSSGVLDLCCGSGQISRGLEDSGFHVTGIDQSTALIEFAKINSPESSFSVADARRFNLPAHFQAAISLNDSLNPGALSRISPVVLARSSPPLVPEVWGIVKVSGWGQELDEVVGGG